MPSKLPNGSWPVLFTPFTESKEVDMKALDAELDLYLETRQAGLFANALSGEVFDLSLEECSRIAERLVQRSRGRIPVVSSGNFGPTLDDQARSMKAIRETGVDAVIILISALPSPNSLVGQILRLAEKVEGPLGLYECPVPEHRLLTPDEVKILASSGRFVFMKETSRTVPTYTEKLHAAQGTPMQVFQANLRCAPGSLENGAPGLCGIFSNFCPEWTARLCELGGASSEEGAAVFRSLVAFHDVAIKNGYPSSGKYFLQKRGLPITTVSRSTHTHAFGEKDRSAIDRFLGQVSQEDLILSQEDLEQILKDLGTAPIFD